MVLNLSKTILGKLIAERLEPAVWACVKQYKIQLEIAV